MDYILKNPIVHEGDTYDIALFHLSSAPVVREGDYSTAVNLQVIPACRKENEMKVLYSEAIRIEMTANIKTQPSSEKTLAAYAQVSEIIVTLANELNIIKLPE